MVSQTLVKVTGTSTLEKVDQANKSQTRLSSPLPFNISRRCSRLSRDFSLDIGLDLRSSFELGGSLGPEGRQQKGKKQSQLIEVGDATLFPSRAEEFELTWSQS